MEFEEHLPENILRLCADINTDRYKHGNYLHKIINEKKRRDIAVASVRDRLVHRLLYDYLVYKCDNHFDYDVWSCRIGKGNLAAINRTGNLLRKYPHSYVWRGDIQKFFDHVDHRILRRQLARYELGVKANSLLDIVIKSYEAQLLDIHTERQAGIPIGNLTSQIFANIYLNEFDRFVRHELKPLAYVRYGDDFLLFANAQNKALTYQSLGAKFLNNELHLKLHNLNNLIVQAKKGLRYLGVVSYSNGKTLSNGTFKQILDKTTLLNQDTYKAHVLQYGSRNQVQIREGHIIKIR